MSQPRSLVDKLPSPSEQGNFDKCPCYWWLHDRLWIKPTKDVIPFMYGRALDDCMGLWLTKSITNTQAILDEFDIQANQYFAKAVTEDDKEQHMNMAQGTRDAIVAWLTLYGSQDEQILDVQPKISLDCNVKIDYVVAMTEPLIRVRERKLLSPAADIDHEINMYQLGFQPAAYRHQAEKHYVGKHVECVEMEFFIRSAPAKGKYKPTPASIRREPIYVSDEKVDMWLASAEYANMCMQSLDQAITMNDGLPFNLLPRRTSNCIKKLGKKTYECDYFKACKTFTNPLMMPEHYYQSGGKDAVAGAEAIQVS